MHHVIVGTEKGFVKYVNFNDETWTNPVAKPTAPVIALRNIDSRTLVGLKNGAVSILKDNCIDWTGNFGIEITGYGVIGDHIVACDNEGDLKSMSLNGDIKKIANVGKNVKSVEISGTSIATGGRENDLKIYDFKNAKNAVFEAKNVKHNWLDMRVPVWIRGIALESEGVVCTCTHYKHVRCYDIRERQRRPILDFIYGDEPFSCIYSLGERKVVVGGSQGSICLFDLRKATAKGEVCERALVQKFKGVSGAVTSLSHSGGFLFSTSSDRFAAVHSIDKKVLVRRTYLKQRLTCLLPTGAELDLSETDLFGLEYLRRADVLYKQQNRKRKEETEEKNDSGDEIWTRIGASAETNVEDEGIGNGVEEKKRKIKAG